jgi:hypothetical protein
LDLHLLLFEFLISRRGLRVVDVLNGGILYPCIFVVISDVFFHGVFPLLSLCFDSFVGMTCVSYFAYIVRRFRQLEQNWFLLIFFLNGLPWGS